SAKPPSCDSERFRTLPRTCPPRLRYAEHAVNRPTATERGRPDVGPGAAGIRGAARRGGGYVAVRRARTATGDAGDRIPGQRVARCLLGPPAHISTGAQGSWLCRGPERRNRISLGRGTKRPTA